MGIHVLDEACRCLRCSDPMCRKGCPVDTAIPEMIEELQKNNIDKAGEMLFENNPLSLICSFVCNHESQCEGHCALGTKTHPVHISSIETYISNAYFDKMKCECQPPNGKMVAVIGAGPAGITISFILAKLGYSVTIFDAKDKIGGVLQYGIPEFRLPKTILDRYRTKLLELGVRIRPNATIGGALEIEELFRDGYKSVFAGTGVWRPKKLGVKGETLGNVHFAIDYLANPKAFELGEKVAIIGNGNAAMDVARTMLRNGVQKVTLYGRGSEIAANPHEVAYARVDGAEFVTNRQIIEITERGPLFQDTLNPDERELAEADSTIIAISQGPKNKLVLTTKGLKSSERGLLITDEKGKTTSQGVFAAGDVVNGAKSVVAAVADAKIVAEEMHRFMSESD